MNAKKWLKIWFFVILLFTLPIITFNFLVDPLWTFSHTNSFNHKQLAFNERQQKSNFIYFNGLEKFDGIMFGSSRTTFINQNDFLGMNIYNYALDSMYPFEYLDYLNFAKEVKGDNFKFVIIGADFYNTKVRTIKRFEDPNYYISETKSFLYRYKMLANFELLKKSINNLNANTAEPPLYYLRNNVKIRNKVSEPERISSYTQNIIRHTNSFSNVNYKWNDDYFVILKRLKQENPTTKFIIFTSPISADLFVSIIRNTNKWSEYERWIRNLVDIFGTIYCFMDINSVTTNVQNYPDDDHYYPYIGKILANKISTNSFNIEPIDFGTVVNKNNLESFLAKQKERVNSYQFSESYPYQEIKQKLNVKE